MELTRIDLSSGYVPISYFLTITLQEKERLQACNGKSSHISHWMVIGLAISFVQSEEQWFVMSDTLRKKSAI